MTLLLIALLLTPVADNQVINANNIGSGQQVIYQIRVENHVEPLWFDPNPHEYLHRPIINYQPATIQWIKEEPYEIRPPANNGSDRDGR